MARPSRSAELADPIAPVAVARARTLVETSGGQFILAFIGGDPGTVTLTNATVRYQSTGLLAAVPPSERRPPTPPPPPPGVPEPATWAMMLFGFGAVGYTLRRRRRTGIAQLA